jgi:site-specific recombinase XerD
LERQAQPNRNTTMTKPAAFPVNLSSARGGPVSKEEVMSYATPAELFKDPLDAEFPLDQMFDDYLVFLAGRGEEPVSQHTIRKYAETQVSFLKSLTLHGTPLVLGSVNVRTVRQWVLDQRTGALPSARKGRPAQKCSDGSIGPRIAALKAFTCKYVHHELKWTKHDLLEDLERWKRKDKTKEPLTEIETAAIRGSFEDLDNTFEAVRDRAIYEVHMSTALRYGSVLGIELSNLDRSSGKVVVIIKGNREVWKRIDPAAMRHVRRYMERRPATKARELFVKDNGEPMTYDGARNIWRRIQKRSGVEHVGSHQVRYTVVQNAAKKGATVAQCQSILNHTTPTMAMHYLGQARDQIDADENMQWSLSA